jgi:purine nucleoside phosphorylase
MMASATAVAGEVVGAHTLEAVEAAATAVRAHSGAAPEVAIVLGTGLGGLAAEIDVETSVPYEDIPGFPHSTVESHAGRLLFGTLGGRRVVAMQGRLHRYEGYSLQQVTFPIRVLRALAREVAASQRIVLREGVYVAVAGPNLETRAEYRMLRSIGADVVGMSTVPEVIVALHGGMRVLGVSIITDMCLPDALEPADLPTIIATASRAEPKLTALVRGIIERL